MKFAEIRTVLTLFIAALCW